MLHREPRSTSVARSRRIARLVGRYDLRARFPEDLNAEDGELLGGFLAKIGEGGVLVGRDTRTESQKIQASLIRGLKTAGRDAFDMGILPTPVLAFGCRLWNMMGIMVTPSHNPVGEVGIKGFSCAGEIWGNEWDLLRKGLRRGSFGGVMSSARPRQISIIHPRPQLLKSTYLEVASEYGVSDITVVVDPRGGATVDWASAALRAAGANVIALNDRHSANFFGQSPEPSLSNIATLSTRVKKESANFGVTFDGDGDRVLIVNSSGDAVPPEAVALLLRRENDEFPIIASSDVSTKLEALAKVIRAPVGARNIVQAMKNSNAKLGFELSDHYYLQEAGYASDGIGIACRIGSLHTHKGSILDNATKLFGAWNREITSVRFSNRTELIRGIASLRRDWPWAMSRWEDGYKLGGQSDGDVVFCRPSNTEPKLRVIVETESRDRTMRLSRRVLGSLHVNLGKQRRSPS